MGGPRRTSDGRGRRGSVLSGVAVAIGCVLFLGGFVWGAVLYQPYTVPTDSMSPTIGKDDRVLAERVDGSDVHRGDVVVFRDSVWGDMPMVKRVVGVGGDKIACCDKQGRLTVNGKAIDEPYLAREGRASPTMFSATVPGDHLFLLGDNRDTSVDSRGHLTDGDQGTVSRDAVDARVEAVVWPLGAMGTLEEPSGFDGLPGGVSERGPLTLITGMVVAGAVLILGGAAYGPLTRRTSGKGKPPHSVATSRSAEPGARSGAERAAGAVAPGRQGKPGDRLGKAAGGTGHGAARPPGAAEGASTDAEVPGRPGRGGKGTARSSG
ncbi:signal peptidase I [Streptomyces zagrosensis]|uniref:Signal peptidase I n=1 Tax=Streptomyces zagrosensis TaxID=1042984 RepID=A0A7W9UYS9_9ACTN|nr:signal peptidase I [Streptomyces zagrosensis]